MFCFYFIFVVLLFVFVCFVLLCFYFLLFSYICFVFLSCYFVFVCCCCGCCRRVLSQSSRALNGAPGRKLKRLQAALLFLLFTCCCCCCCYYCCCCSFLPIMRCVLATVQIHLYTNILSCKSTSGHYSIQSIQINCSRSFAAWGQLGASWAWRAGGGPIGPELCRRCISTG